MILINSTQVLWCTSHPNVMRNKLEAALMRCDDAAPQLARTFSQLALIVEL